MPEAPGSIPSVSTNASITIILALLLMAPHASITTDGMKGRQTPLPTPLLLLGPILAVTESTFGGDALGLVSDLRFSHWRCGDDIRTL